MADAAARLRSLPGAREPALPPLPPLVCRRPSCSNPVVAKARGRRRDFCHDDCRRALAREQEQIRAHVTALRALAEQYGVLAAFDDPAGSAPSESRRRPPPLVEPARTALAHIALELDLAEAAVEDGRESGNAVSAEVVVGRLRAAKRQADRMLLGDMR